MNEPQNDYGADEANISAEHLAVYKRPRRIVLVPAIPHTPNGKLSRRLLPQLAGAR